jgi:hypothetical protein
MSYDIARYASAIPPYSGLKLYDSPNRETNAFIPYYATEKDLSEINKFLGAWKYKPGSDLIDVLFTDKVNATKFSIVNLISQMRERRVIKKRNLERIDYDTDRFKTELAQIEDLCLYNEIFNLDNRKTKINLDGKIAGLKKEKRAEETSCWRDLTQLRKELTDLIKEYRIASRKKELIANPEIYSLEVRIGNDRYS